MSMCMKWMADYNCRAGQSYLEKDMKRGKLVIKDAL